MGAARASAHVNYIQYRQGEDREKGPRAFFTSDRDRVEGREVKQAIDEQGRAPVTIHKLILSPGLENVDLNQYTREVLAEVGRGKGLDFIWYGVKHGNTDHDHCHVVIMGKDQHGRAVKFDREDFKHFREAGDRYLDREHFWERLMQRDRDPERVLKEPYTREGDWDFQRLVDEINRKPGADRPLPEKEKEPEREPYKAKPWDKEAAITNLPENAKIRVEDAVYSKYSSLEDLQNVREMLKSGELGRLPKDEFNKLSAWIDAKERSGDDIFDKKAKDKWDRKEKGKEERDIDEHRRMDKELHKLYEQSTDRRRPMGRGQRTLEGAGRLAEDHGHYESIKELQRLKELGEQFPERKEELEKQMEEVREFDRQQSAEVKKGWSDFDALLGERWNDDDREDKGKEKGKEQTKAGDRQQQDKGQDKQQDGSHDQLQQTDGDAWETHEADRQVENLIDPVREDQERDEESFGRNER
jgi:hypothetical protein